MNKILKSYRVKKRWYFTPGSEKINFRLLSKWPPTAPFSYVSGTLKGITRKIKNPLS